jgi:hypothetical protein
MEGLENKNLEQVPQLPYVSVLDVDKALADPRQLAAQMVWEKALQPQAMILLGAATGTTPDSLNEYIREFTTLGIPVFVLSKNYGRRTGVQETGYESQQNAKEAGAVFLKEVNIYATMKVVQAIQTSIQNGHRGKDLVGEVIKEFGVADSAN